jgi:hypothetical protein
MPPSTTPLSLFPLLGDQALLFEVGDNLGDGASHVELVCADMDLGVGGCFVWRGDAGEVWTRSAAVGWGLRLRACQAAGRGTLFLYWVVLHLRVIPPRIPCSTPP